MKMNDRAEDIAIIGLAGRFPGANTIDEYWENICDGKETIYRFSDEELIKAGIDQQLIENKSYVKSKGILSAVEYFDPDFFGLSPLEAKILDPQHRVMLMCAWEAFESAGYVPKPTKNKVGVFVSTGMSFYLLKNLLSNSDFLKNVDEYQLLLGNDKDFLATRISYLLNLQGPSINIQTGCSSSLVSVHYACQSLLNGECEMALAGGVSVTIPQEQGYLYQKNMIGSSDGHCYAFDERAQGTVKSNGAGIVLLKPLADALRDNDRIFSVIKGTAVNNDGANKVGYTAPSVSQQAAVIKEALQMAEVDPEEIGYIETHGTGTLLGDPIEISALKQAFSDNEHEKRCALASLKTNMGHLDVAAGIAGLIKASLAVQHGKIPASLNFNRLNPKINLTDSPFYINTALQAWPDNFEHRYAGISAFGIGGTNAHVVIQQPPITQNIHKNSTQPNYLLTFSAKSAVSLSKNMQALLAYMEKNPKLSLADIAKSLQTERSLMPYRYALSINSLEDMCHKVKEADLDSIAPIKRLPSIVFMFSGQGSQYAGMAKALYQHDQHFKYYLDECFSLFSSFMDVNLKDIIFPHPDNKEANEQLKQTAIAQPALFSVEYALAQSYLARGIKPEAVLGHSVGEYVAAVLAGIFTLQDAARLISLRGKLVQRLPSGSMLAVFQNAESLKNKIPQQVDIALINSPSVTVVSGSTPSIVSFAKKLEEMNIRSQLLHTSHAFHSYMLDDILEEFSEVVATTKRCPPVLPIASNLTGNWMTAEDVCSVDYWVKQLRHAVKFSDCIQLISNSMQAIFIEVGPGRTLQNFVYQHGIKAAHNSLPQANENICDHQVFTTTLAELWNAGFELAAITSGERVSLPTYQWDLQRCWVESSNTKIVLDNVKLDPVLEGTMQDPKDIIKNAWMSTLGLIVVDELDNFFSMGGNSLLAIQFINRLPEAWQDNVSVIHLYQFPVFKQFLGYVNSFSMDKDMPISHDGDEEWQLFSSGEEL